MSKKDGGPTLMNGMSLRDYFAAAVIQGCEGNSQPSLTREQMADESGVPVEAYNPNTHWPKFIAGWAYKVSDAMLEARKLK